MELDLDLLDLTDDSDLSDLIDLFGLLVSSCFMVNFFTDLV